MCSGAKSFDTFWPPPPPTPHHSMGQHAPSLPIRPEITPHPPTPGHIAPGPPTPRRTQRTAASSCRSCWSSSWPHRCPSRPGRSALTEPRSRGGWTPLRQRTTVGGLSSGRLPTERHRRMRSLWTRKMTTRRAATAAARTRTRRRGLSTCRPVRMAVSSSSSISSSGWGNCFRATTHLRGRRGAAGDPTWLACGAR